MHSPKSGQKTTVTSKIIREKKTPADGNISRLTNVTSGNLQSSIQSQTQRGSVIHTSIHNPATKTQTSSMVFEKKSPLVKRVSQKESTIKTLQHHIKPAVSTKLNLGKQKSATGIETKGIASYGVVRKEALTQRERANQKIGQLEKTVSQMKQRAGQMEGKQLAYLTCLEELRQQNTQLIEDNEDLRKKIEKYKLLSEESKNMLKQRITEFNGGSGELQELRGQVKALEDRVYDLQKQNSELKAHQKKEGLKNESDPKQYDQLFKLVEQVEKITEKEERMSVESMVQDLEVRYRVLSDELSGIIAEKCTQIDRLELENDSLRTSLEQKQPIQPILQSQETIYLICQAELAECRVKIQDLQLKNREMVEQMEHLKAQERYFKAALDAERLKRASIRQAEAVIPASNQIHKLVHQMKIIIQNNQGKA